MFRFAIETSSFHFLIMDLLELTLQGLGSDLAFVSDSSEEFPHRRIFLSNDVASKGAGKQ